ncbi:ChbG/HpnK family deacetylase [Breoghania sp.]|uniref:ChbG/HpnK family deacetylase n=1 Tax=Breoghania sp. TaxID=2065378 RepID=UPI002637E570|nr:ChbG/HpnK family deacetylase [Breoghania sp.]MDJ0930195.1 ChbG/HpnK family deacetylase [Breoghania sp.]
MKRIVLTVLDYGTAFGVDRAIRTLLADNRLTAVGCVAASDRWPREYLPLRDQVNMVVQRTRVGLTLALSRPFASISDPAREVSGPRFPAPRYYSARGMLGLLPNLALKMEIEAQLSRFEEYYGRPPAFIALHDGLDHKPGVVKLVVEVMGERFRSDWPDFLFSAPERLRSKLLARQIRKLSGDTNHEAVSLPLTTEPGALHRFFWRGLEGRRDGTSVWCAPAQRDDHLRKLAPEAEIEARDAQFTYLDSPDFLLALTE